MKFWVKIEENERRVDVEEKDGHYIVIVDGVARTVDCRATGQRDYLSLIIDNKSYLIESAPTKFDQGKYFASIFGRRYDVEVLDERLVATRQAAVRVDDGPYVVHSPMPGLVIEVRVNVGDKVTAGSPLVIMEAMKMQNELVSEVDGVVTAISVAANDAVESQAPLIEIERAE